MEEHVCLGCGVRDTTHPSQICDTCAGRKKRRRCPVCGTEIKPADQKCLHCQREAPRDE